MKSHIHEESRTFTCYLLALEPAEDCPAHGCGTWPPRCGECGQFLKREVMGIRVTIDPGMESNTIEMRSGDQVVRAAVGKSEGQK